MGTWGTGIFDDDTAADVRDDYRDLIASGSSDTDALMQMQAQFLHSSIGEGIAPLFWLALAYAQWEIGRLDDETKKRATDIIGSGRDLENWRALGASASDIAARANVLATLNAALESQQKPRKKPRRRKQRKSPYDVGDVVSFTLSSSRFVLFRVTSIVKSRDGEDPLAEPLDWIGTSIPPRGELAKLACRQRIKPGSGFASTRSPRILLADLSLSKFDKSRFNVIATGLEMPAVTSESFSHYPLEFLERALAEEFGLS